MTITDQFLKCTPDSIAEVRGFIVSALEGLALSQEWNTFADIVLVLTNGSDSFYFQLIADALATMVKDGTVIARASNAASGEIPARYYRLA